LAGIKRSSYCEINMAESPRFNQHIQRCSPERAPDYRPAKLASRNRKNTTFTI
jgi:hypothetical protein